MKNFTLSNLHSRLAFAAMVALAVTASASVENAFAKESTQLEIQLKNSAGEEIGTATVFEEGRGIKLTLNAKGLPPGKHGIHIHETGDCVAPRFESAGGHFNPSGHEHGTKASNGPHAGDLGNVTVKANGTLKTSIKNKHLSLGGEKSSLRKAGGTSIVIHAKADDQKTQPSGDSGDRIACGVIPGITN